ncbi:MAG: phosphate ABC transporter substrate-binding protein PstS, partial [Burkholderiaceae bacterium]
MYKRALLNLSAGIALGAFAFMAQAADITGAGASFPYPVYAKWAAKYHETTGNQVNYQSIGSGGGQQ